MKNVIFALFAFLAVNMSFAQSRADDKSDDGVDNGSGNYDVLRILYADEKYEKLLKVAEKYTMKDATKNDAEPYLWIAKALFAMSKDENYTNQDKYKKAYNDALTWLGKYYKKDKDLKLYEDHREFFIEVKRSVYETIETEMFSGNYAKAHGSISKIAKVSPNNFASDFLTGACNFQKGDKTVARESWKKAEALLKNLKVEDFMNWEKPDKMLLALGLVETGKCHVKAKKPEVARELLNKYKSWFEDFEFYQEFLQEL
jgi:hypothetical protein